jgi:hypothetical protein
MIDLKKKYHITIAVRAEDGGTRPMVGDVVQSKGFLFAVKKSTERWITLTAVIKNKVEYIECLAKFKQDTPVEIEDWYPSLSDSDLYIKYKGNIVFVGYYEVTSSRP